MDLSFLKSLYERPGPYASVYADLSRTTEDASKAAELRWRALREELEGQAAYPPDTLHAIEQTIEEELRDRRSEGLAIFSRRTARSCTWSGCRSRSRTTGRRSGRCRTSSPTSPSAESGSPICWPSSTAAGA